jgi:chromosome segregation ATPase
VKRFDINVVSKMIQEERETIKWLREKVEQMVNYCDSERQTCRNTLEDTKSQLYKSKLSLKKQMREIKKLQEDITSVNDKYHQLEISNKDLMKQLEDMKTKWSRTNTSLLAMKGRRTLEQKREQKEKDNLEKKELDEMIVKEEQMRSKLEIDIRKKEGEMLQLRKELQLKDEQIMKMKNEMKEIKFNTPEKIMEMEEKLQLSMDELRELKELMNRQRKELKNTQQHLQVERQHSQLLLTKTQSTIDQMLSQLNRERLDHQKEVESLNVTMVMQKQDWSVEMDRLKDVSMKRCHELAKELQLLKSTK